MSLGAGGLVLAVSGAGLAVLAGLAYRWLRKRAPVDEQLTPSDASAQDPTTGAQQDEHGP